MECKCESCVRQDCQERTKQDDSRIVTCCSDYLERKTTNADSIRAMSDEELADMRVHYNPEVDMYTNDTGEAYCDFVSAMEAELEWLKQPAEGE